MIERSPLWPASPPPFFTFRRRDGQVELVLHDDDLLGLDAVAAGQRGHRQPGVVHVGERDRERDQRRRRCAPGRPGRAPCPCAALAPWRFASSSTISAPTLWRVRAYSSPGFPSPTTSRSAAVPRRRSTGYSSPASSEASAARRLGPPSAASPSSPSPASPSLVLGRRPAAPRPARRRSRARPACSTPVGQRDVLDAQLVADGEPGRRRSRSTPGCCRAWPRR